MADARLDTTAAQYPRAPPKAAAICKNDLTSAILPDFFTINLCTCCIAALISKSIVHLQHLIIFSLKQRQDDGGDTKIEGNEQ